MGGMGDLAGKTAKQTDEQLSEVEAGLLMRTSVDLEALRPQIADQDAYDKLIEAVSAATAKNESAAQLREQLSTLGKEVEAVAKKAFSLIPA